MKNLILAFIFAVSITVNALAVFVAAYPLLRWGINPWTLAVCGAVGYPLGSIIRMLIGGFMVYIFAGGAPKAQA